MSDGILSVGPSEIMTATESEKPKAGVVAAAAREAAYTKFLLDKAANHPRHPQKVYADVLHTCELAEFADGALYRFPRGWQTKADGSYVKDDNGRRVRNYVEGPAVKLAREIARAWGNQMSGYRVVDKTAMDTTIEGYFLDCETGSLKTYQHTFRRRIWRRGKDGEEGRWVEPDDREYRELEARLGAIVERNAILNSVPHHFVEQAKKRCQETINAFAKNELKRDRDTVLNRLADAFRKIGVDVEQLEAFMGHSIKEVDHEELSELAQIHASIRDGNSTIREHFAAQDDKAEKPAADPQAPSLDSLAAEADEQDGVAPDPPKPPRRGRKKR